MHSLSHRIDTGAEGFSVSRSPLSNASKRISVSTGIDVTGEVMLTQGARFRIVIAMCVWS